MTVLFEPATAATAATGSPPRVLGLDLSMTATGMCLPDGTTRTIKTRQKDGDKRLTHIVTEIIAARLAALGIDLVVMEEAPPGLKGPAIKAIHMVHGAVRVHLIKEGIPYALINPTTLKIYATGKSAADKTAMTMAAYKRAGIEFADDNQCDAYWLRAAGLDRAGHPLFPMPQAQRVALDKASWPQAVTW